MEESHVVLITDTEKLRNKNIELNEAVINDFLQRNNFILPELGTPKKKTLEDNSQFMSRIMRVDIENAVGIITDLKFENNKLTGMYKADKKFIDPIINNNCCFGYRGLAIIEESKTKLSHLITFDYINNPDINHESKEKDANI